MRRRGWFLSGSRQEGGLNFSEEDWGAVPDANLKVAIFLAQAAARHMVGAAAAARLSTSPRC
jgi:NAD(P)-dependent dehydrogenase (short-subunit alcohol dehydrogenase family)